MGALDDFKKVKEASGFNLGAAAGKIPGALAEGALMAGGGAAVAGAGLAAQKIFNAITKKHDFNTMLENNADLQEHYDTNPKRFNLMFTTLRNMNPEFSKDPLVAGTYMRRMVESPASAGAIAVEALGSRQDMQSPATDMFMRGAFEGVKSKLSK